MCVAVYMFYISMHHCTEILYIINKGKHGKYNAIHRYIYIVFYIHFLSKNDGYNSRYGSVYNYQVLYVNMNPKNVDNYITNNNDSTHHTGYYLPSNQKLEKQLANESNQNRTKERL